MKLILGAIVFCFTLCVVIVTAVFFYGYGAWSGAGPLAAPHTTIIARGSGVQSIATQLEQDRVIKNALVFKAAVRLTGVQTALKAGEYEFVAGQSMKSVIGQIAAGAVVDRKVTLREGLTSWQVVQILKTAEGLTGDITVIPPEGSLLPETYHFTRDQDRNSLIAEMSSAMTRTMDGLWPDRALNLPFDTPAQAMVLASIVEKETGIAAERARIAGVFVNRLRKGMALQTDPTVIYAITKGEVKDDGMGPLGRRLLRKDLLETDSPYNTYKYPGLPPGPIANPGRAAIEATLHPEEHDYIYFVADGTGGHLFARTLAEHEKNVAQWRKIRKEQGN